ncbi:MAG TPA: LuxR C-terminal-related transcriptional regulator [Streptosporangiaceae bacterium]|nr:LuxR C-terminal-related transcriptional regulator [Streptosporangiaceae bacterium]
MTRALTLCGAGGIGKTRLALQVVAGVADEFPDGTWFVELGDLQQPDLVVSRVASAVGVGEEPGRPLIETLAEALRPRRLLLTLDNCEHLIDACARLCQRLLASSPGLRVITTSREPLHVAAETVWQVQPLSVAPNGAATPEDAFRYEAVRLFAARAAASLSGFTLGPANAAAVAAVCRALDGVPLAIELAAAWVRTLSVEQIAARLADRFALLTTGNRTAPPRQRTLRAAMDWSYELLTTSEQVLLRRLSVFVGWSLEMAEQVCSDDDLPAPEVLGLLASLMDKSLVVREPEVLGQARYRLLDTIREYAAARLADAGETAAVQGRLRDYTVALAEHNLAIGMARVPAPWSARVDVFRRYDVDAGNVLQILGRCLADGNAETGLRLCTAVRPCWIVRGTFTEGGEWLDSLLAIDAAAVAPGVRGAALVGRAQLALPSDSAAAESRAQEGLELCRAAGDQWWTAAALNLLSEIALHTGRMDEATSAADEALSIAQAAGDGWNEGYALGIRGAIAGLLGRLREAEQLVKSSIAIMRRIDQQWGVARALLGLGDLARLRGDPGGAHSRYLEALAILREIDARPDIARCLAGLARVAMDLGSLGQARQHFAESIRLSHSTGSRIGVARGLEAFAALAVQEDRPELAVQLTAAATALREAAGFPPLAGARAERYLAPARRLGGPAIARVWARGLAMSGEAAVALALDAPQATGADTVVLTAVGVYDVATAPPGTLTPRERQVAALVADGRSNKSIAEELFISPATAARHVANILAKLGFSSRAQIAAWAADKQLDPADPATAAGPGPDPSRGAGQASHLRLDTGRGLSPMAAGPAGRRTGS